MCVWVLCLNLPLDSMPHGFNMPSTEWVLKTYTERMNTLDWSTHTGDKILSTGYATH